MGCVSSQIIFFLALLNLLAGVEWKNLISIDRNKDRAREGINKVVIVTDERVDIVLSTLDGDRVHGLNPPLRSKLLFFFVITNNLNSASLSGDNFCSNCHIDSSA